jgi:hypothetical protein
VLEQPISGEAYRWSVAFAASPVIALYFPHSMRGCHARICFSYPQ